MHYPRIPPEYWAERLKMARAMGLQAISTYVFWNRHEPAEGRFDFSGGNDLGRFIRLAQREDLAVVLRPGPYVCAEWDWGGLPAWLLKDAVAVRTADETFMAPVRRWLRRLGKEIAGLQRRRGGPIIAVQLENEYGAFGSDKDYLRALRAALRDAELDASPLYTIDQPGDLARGALDDLPIAVTFAPGDPGAQFEQLHALRPQASLLCGEYWAGWFDHWGEAHSRLDDEAQAADLDWMLSRGASVNVYMFHGGTNFGFWNGANAFEPSPYQPTTTSYDYQAALDEAGRPTAKYFRFRQIIERRTGTTAPAVPPSPQTVEIPRQCFERALPLGACLPQPVHHSDPLSMEALDQAYGYVLYRTTLPGPGDGVLEIDEVRDYAVVMLDGRVVADLDRRLAQSQCALESREQCATLDVLIENCGRINYGPQSGVRAKGYYARRALERTRAPWMEHVRSALRAFGTLRLVARAS